jgi:hypothetical protein
VTSRVTNHPKNLDQVVANPNDSKEIKFRKKRLKFKLLSRLIPMPLSRIFYLFYKVDFDFDPKTLIHPSEFPYRHANPQKNLRSGSNCFRCPNRAKGSLIFQTQIPEFV